MLHSLCRPNVYTSTVETHLFYSASKIHLEINPSIWAPCSTSLHLSHQARPERFWCPQKFPRFPQKFPRLPKKKILKNSIQMSPKKMTMSKEALGQIHTIVPITFQATHSKKISLHYYYYYIPNYHPNWRRKNCYKPQRPKWGKKSSQEKWNKKKK